MTSNTYSCFKIVIVSYLLFAIEVGKNEVAIAYKYKEVGINNSTELRWAKVQLGRRKKLDENRLDENRLDENWAHENSCTKLKVSKPCY